jgi:hypothetical protein
MAQSKLGALRAKKRKDAKAMDKQLETAGSLVPEEHKFGDGPYHFATGPKQLHVTGPNQALTGDKDGTKLQAGKAFTLGIKDPSSFKLELEQGQYSLHPQVNQRPSTDAYPLQVFIQSVPMDVRQIAKLSKTVRELLAIFSG